MIAMNTTVIMTGRKVVESGAAADGNEAAALDTIRVIITPLIIVEVIAARRDITGINLFDCLL